MPIETTSQIIGQTVAVFGGLLILSVFIEGTVEYFLDNKNEAKPQPYLKYVAAVLGVLVCVLFDLDLFAAFGLSATVPFVGNVMTGIVIGRGSNYLNDFVSKFTKPREAVVIKT